MEGGKISHRFVPIARRTLHTVTCDVTGYTSQLDLETRLLDAMSTIPSADLVKAVLVGKVAGDAQKDLVHLGAILSERFYFAKLRDESRLLINPEDYRHDVSLKGEFVRRVMASSLSDLEKERVIACGFRALCGEEVGV